MEYGMATSFEQYSDILLDAYKHNARAQDLAEKKREILEELFGHYDTNINSVLFIGFSPSLLSLDHAKITVTEVSDTVKDYLIRHNANINFVNKQDIKQKQFDVTVAVDEYLTFSESDADQKKQVDWLCSITNDFIITTLRDYKNQDYRDREFSQPISVRNNVGKKIYFENYDYDINDRNACSGTCYTVSDDGVTITGPFARRSMFFKQLAKFSLDAGARSFLVHKNLMHKSIIKKNYEHIITIKF
jgi:hypothetical protein